MKPKISKSKIMKEAWRLYKRANGQNAWIYIGEQMNTAVFADCMKVAWYFEKREHATAVKEYELEQMRKSVAMFQQTEEYKAIKKRQQENPFAWLTPEVMENYYRTTKYQGD